MDSSQKNQLGVKQQTLYNGIPLLSMKIAKISYLKTLAEKVSPGLGFRMWGVYVSL